MAKTILDEQMRLTVIINGDEAQQELFKLDKRQRDLAISTKALKGEKAKLAAQGKQNSQEYKNITAEIKKNNTEVDANKIKIKALQNQIGITALSMRQLRARAAELRVSLHGMAPGSAEYNRLNADLRRVNARIKELTLQSRAAEGSISKLANGFSKYAALGASVIAMGTGVVLSLQKMIDYNGKLSDAQSNVQKTTQLTKKEVDDLTKSFGMMKTRTARIELLELAEEAGRLGKRSVKDVQAFVNVANKLKVALGDDLSTEQIREVGKMAEVYKVATKNGLTYEQALESLGSAINEVSASGANQAGFLVDYLKRQAGISIQTNVSAQDNIAYAATFDEIGQSVEVSATAMNKVWMDMFENTADYAKVAGMNIKDFTILMNTDANAAMIKFLKGLNGNNEGLTVMAERLKDLEVGGARGVQALAALSANTELLETRQKIANEALKEGTSLTTEYEIKNNNLAATIERVQKAIYAAFSSEFIVGALSSLIAKLGDLLGVVDDVEEAFAKETKATAASARESRKLQYEGQKLLDRYNELTQDGIEPTAEAKEELDVIITRLSNKFGESVRYIDAETGAYKLNTEAVKEQIKLKRLAADEEASTLVSRLRGVEDAKKDLETDQKAAQARYDEDKKAFEFINRQALQEIKDSKLISQAEKQNLISRKEGYNDMVASEKALMKIKGEIYSQDKREVALLEELRKLNFTKADADSFFKDVDSSTDPEIEPKEGDIKDINGLTFIYKNGKWVPKTINHKPTGSPDNDTKKRADQLKKEADELLKLQRETEDNRLALMQDAFLREMELNDVNHLRKVDDLRSKISENQKLADAALLSGNTNLASKYVDQNMELFSQIELAEEQHQAKRNEILQSGVENHIKTLEAQYQREEQAREIAHNNEMAALGANEEAKEALQEQYNKAKLEREKQAQIQMIAELNKILETAEFKDFDLEFLTEAQLADLKAKLSELGFSLSAIDVLLAKIKGKDGTELNAISSAFGGTTDMLGFSPDQWEVMFENFDKTEGKLAAIGMGLQAMSEAYAIFDQFARASEERKMQRIDKALDQEKDKQKALLDRKLISQKQYDDAIEGLEKEAAKQKAEIEYNQAKRQKQMNIMNAIGATALAVAQALPNIPLSIIVGALGAIQVGLIAAQPLPAKGFEQGYGMVRREQDGKLFNAAYGGESRSGVVDKPTVFLAGEGGKNFPEMIIDGRTLKQFNPDLKNSLYRELGRIKGFEGGYYKNDSYQVPINNNNEGNTSLAMALNRNSDILERLEENGVIAYMSKDLANIKKMRDELERLKKLENKAKINT